MCRPVNCKECGKTTWAGCGQHVDSVKAQVPVSQWCSGHKTSAKVGAQGADVQQRGFFARLFGR